MSASDGLGTERPELPERLTERAFPSYAFLPGSDPHPTRDPRGHSFGAARDEPPTPWMAADAWRDNELYLFGVDLHNHGYFWEAHEAWEGPWRAAREDPDQACFLRGLIQCSAACLKLRLGRPRGLVRLAERGTGRLEALVAARHERYMGLELAPFLVAMRAFARAHAGAARPTGGAHPLIRL